MIQCWTTNSWEQDIHRSHDHRSRAWCCPRTWGWRWCWQPAPGPPAPQSSGCSTLCPGHQTLAHPPEPRHDQTQWGDTPDHNSNYNNTSEQDEPGHTFSDLLSICWVPRSLPRKMITSTFSPPPSLSTTRLGSSNLTLIRAEISIIFSDGNDKVSCWGSSRPLKYAWMWSFWSNMEIRPFVDRLKTAV